MRYGSYTYEEAKRHFEFKGHILLSTQYSNNKSPLDYKCKCGTVSKISLSNLLKGRDCLSCGKLKVTLTRATVSSAQVSDYLSNLGYTLLKYVRQSEPMSYLCSCGKVTTAYYRTGLARTDWTCKYCRSLEQLTLATVSNNRWSNTYREWRKLVLERDDYECVKCTSNIALRAHHIESFKLNPLLRFLVENGITFCAVCHDQFHASYGQLTTAEQLKLFFNEECN